MYPQTFELRPRGGSRDRRVIASAALAATLVVACGGGDEPNPVGPGSNAPSLEAVSSTTLTAFAGFPVDELPAVRLTNASGATMAGVMVTFEARPGSGVVIPDSVATDTNGVARVSSWVLGPRAIAQRVVAFAPGATPVTFTANAVLPPSPFEITLRFNRAAAATQAQRDAFELAEARWQAAVSADVPDLAITRDAGFCGSEDPIDETVDDLLILIDVEDIDGPGGILGSAGPCLLRSSSIPVVGRMRFDVADLTTLEFNGRLEDVIVHEMGHVMGIGSLWRLLGLVGDSARAGVPSDPFFTGPAARQAFLAAGGDQYTGNIVPIEGGGGSGTRLAHWRESVLANELMTGFINEGPNPLSTTTIASLADLGYEVNLAAAEPFRLSFALSRSRSAGAGRIDLGNDLLLGPIVVLQEDGGERIWLPGGDR